ncbi:MAG: cytochrome B6, partial [Bacteroidales bacterium]
SIPITYANMRNAIGAFERTLITPTKFDSYLSGDITALNTQERQGLKLFIDQGCIACHTGPLLGGTMLQKFGLYGDYTQYVHPTVADAGKFNETKIEADKDMFYVPGLRNVEKTYPYFHNGGVNNLNESIQIMGKLQLNKELNPQQVDDIAVFFGTLTGDIPADLKKAPEL